MNDDAEPATRRGLLIAGVTLAGLTILGEARQAHADGGTLPKPNAKYQDHPNDGQGCGACAYWISGPKTDEPGACKIVAGPIAPNAWCILFAPKPA